MDVVYIKCIRDLSWGIESSEDSDGHERKGGRNMSMSMRTALGNGYWHASLVERHLIALGLGHAGGASHLVPHTR